MQFYFRQFAGDEHVMAMDLDSVGAHILLMCAAGASEFGYRLASDERQIRTRLRNPSDSDWSRIRQQLLAGPWKVSPDGKWWIQDGMRRSVEKQKTFSEKQTKNAHARWHANDIPEPIPEPIPNGIPKACSSSSSSSSTIQNSVSDPINVGIGKPLEKHTLTDLGSKLLVKEFSEPCVRHYVRLCSAHLATTGKKLEPEKFSAYVEKWIRKDQAENSNWFATQHVIASASARPERRIVSAKDPV